MNRTDTFNPGCGETSLSLSTPAQTATLDTDKHILLLFCPIPVPQQATEPVDGLEVDSGLGNNYVGVAPGQCAPLTLPSAGGLSACEDDTLPYSVLTLRVTLSEHPKPVFVSIGLAGNGVVARTILYSLRAA